MTPRQGWQASCTTLLSSLFWLCSPHPPSLQCRVKTWEESKGEVDGIEAATTDFKRDLEIVICRTAAKAFPVRRRPDDT